MSLCCDEPWVTTPSWDLNRLSGLCRYKLSDILQLHIVFPAPITELAKFSSPPGQQITVKQNLCKISVQTCFFLHFTHLQWTYFGKILLLFCVCCFLSVLDCVVFLSRKILSLQKTNFILADCILKQQVTFIDEVPKKYSFPFLYNKTSTLFCCRQTWKAGNRLRMPKALAGITKKIIFFRYLSNPCWTICRNGPVLRNPSKSSHSQPGSLAIIHMAGKSIYLLFVHLDWG